LEWRDFGRDSWIDLGIMAETGMGSAQHLNPARLGIGDITHLI
jgi:hypothetical protein